MRMAGKPADDEHPYGHTQLESIAALVVGAFVITTAITIFWQSISQVYQFFTGENGAGTAAQITLVIALITVMVKVWLWYISRRIGKETGITVVSALAYDHRNDIFTALAATIGITFSLAGYPWVDPLAGALVALVILRTGIKILRELAVDLMDTIPGRDLAEQIDDLLCTISGVRQIEEIHAHRFGPYLVVNLTVGINGSLTVSEGDQISDEVEERLLENITNLKKVHVHYHPYQQLDQPWS